MNLRGGGPTALVSIARGENENVLHLDIFAKNNK